MAEPIAVPRWRGEVLGRFALVLAGVGSWRRVTVPRSRGGRATTVRLYRVEGGGHAWSAGDLDAFAEILALFVGTAAG